MLQLKYATSPKLYDKEVFHGVSFTVVGRAMGFRRTARQSTTIRCLMDVFKQDSGGFYLMGLQVRSTA